MEVNRATDGSAEVLSVGDAIPGAVALGHWGAGTCLAGQVGESAVGGAAGMWLADTYRMGPGAAGARMASPGGLGVDPQEGGTGTGLREARAVRAGTRANTGARALGFSGRAVPRTNNAARSSRVAGAWCPMLAVQRKMGDEGVKCRGYRDTCTGD